MSKQRALASGHESHDDAADLSAESAIQREVAELRSWLSAQGVDLRNDHPGKDGGSREGLYWRYGYFAGLKRALAMLTSQGATLH